MKKGRQILNYAHDSNEILVISRVPNHNLNTSEASTEIEQNTTYLAISRT